MHNNNCAERHSTTSARRMQAFFLSRFVYRLTEYFIFYKITCLWYQALKNGDSFKKMTVALQRFFIFN
jgi:hypothetical protein